MNFEYTNDINDVQQRNKRHTIDNSMIYSFNN